VIRRWIATHKSLVATATSGSVVAALVAAVAIVSTGYTAQRLDLNDASVWVSNGADRFIGRANTDVLELDTVVASDGNDIDVVQRGATVLLVDRGDATLDIVDAATSELGERVPLPPSAPDVFIAGDNVVIYSQGSGEVWITPTADLADFDAEQEPTLSLGAESVLSVDPAGLLFAFAPEAKKVYRVDAAAATAVESTEDTELGGARGDFAVTSVAGRWAVLDVDAARVELAGGVTDLADSLQTGAQPVLQAPSVSGDEVLVAHPGGLLGVPVAGGDIETLSDVGAGTAAAPTVVGGCAYAAWSNGESWRRCGAGGEATTTQLAEMPSAPRLDFQVNDSRVVLNDARDGASWAVAGGGELIDNWDDLISVKEDRKQVEQNDENTPPEIEKDQLPPVAVDDRFGARAGRANLLPVLINDYDPNADVIVIKPVTPLDPAIGRIERIEDNQELQLTLAADAAGVVTFDYTIDDGRGGTATASVEVTVRAPGENSPPQQVRSTSTTVASNDRVSVPALDDWIDPDGDPFYLVSASIAEPMTVSYKPEGTVIVTDGGAGPGITAATLVVSDGTASATGSLTVTTVAAGEVPLIAESAVVLAYAGEEKTISPLDHVRGGNGTVRLNAVPPKVGVTITPSYETGTFRFVSDQVRSHYVEYVVTDNEQTVTGLVRIDVVSPPDSNTAPVTVPKTMFIPTLGSRTIDVAASDIDPAGGVLLVTGVVNVPETSGLRAEVLEQRSVRVTLTGPLAGPVAFGYRISNGLAQSEGTITVVEIAPPVRLQPPIARDDTATVRVGDAITIDVMQNDEQPDGEPITLNPVLVDGLSTSSGLLFVSGNALRYLAPETTGNYIAVYEIIGPLGQTAQARVSIEVREPNAETNHPPVPTTVVARALAGETVRIEVPLDGIDPDGDSVQLLGQESGPEKGGVVEIGPSWIDYEAGAYSAGTDTFTYTVMDALGARATGTVRVGISPKLDGARNPVAIEDEVSVRPGATVSVQVLANDSDPDGNPLTVVAVQPNDEKLTATFDDGEIVEITAPRAPGVYGLVYTIENDVGGSSSNFVSVTVSDDAPLAYPIARDTVLTLSDVLDRDSVTVDVLANVFFADGDARDLDLSIVAGYGDSAVVTPTKRITVTIQDERQIIPFAVSHPDDSGARSYAFLWVPGFRDALPQLNTKAPRLSVASEQSLTIDLDDYVLAVGGKAVRLTDSSTVRATHSDGSNLVVDADTLTFTSADLYFGPASISFEVTDGSSATDPNGRKANLVLPITVNPRENQPPVFTGAAIDFEPAQEKVIDLTNLTTYPYDDDLDELVFAVEGPDPSGFSYELAGQRLTIRASASAVKGGVTALTLGVRDALATGQSGRIQLRVVPSTRPLAVPALDSAIAARGQSTTVDVLANDEATNPFPGRPLRVLAVRGLEGGRLPAGVTVSSSNDNRTLTVSVAASAAPADAMLQYHVADASGDPDRYVWGSVRISVQDVPDAPARPVRQAGSFASGELVLRLTAPQPNNSPISNYRVTSAGYSFDCGTALVCALGGLEVGRKYAFQVTAINAIGESLPSPTSDPYSVDVLPGAPRGVTAVPTEPDRAPEGGAITVSWVSPGDPDRGTPITDYVVEVTGRDPLVVPRSATSTIISGLPTATTFTVAVYARNDAQVASEAEWQRGAASSPVTTVGPPRPPAEAPSAVNQPDGKIAVTWKAFDANGGGTVTYGVRRVTGTTAEASCATPPTVKGLTSTTWIDTATTDGETYTYVVYADNGSYCTAVSSGPAISKASPGPVSGSATAVIEASGRSADSGQFDVRAKGPFAVDSGVAERFEYRLNGGGWAPVASEQWLTSLANSAVYGTPVTVEYRGCRDDSQAYCGPASAAVTLVPVNTRVTTVSCVKDGVLPLAITEPFNNGAATSARYEVKYIRDVLGVPVADPEFSAYTQDPVPSDAIAVRVRATVSVGGATYVDPVYGEFPCT
jgi:hypothetical protein